MQQMRDQKGRPPGPPRGQQPAQQQDMRRDIDAALSGNAAKVIEVGQRLGKELGEKRLAISQIRGILDEIQRLGKGDAARPKAEHDLQMLRAKLAFAAGRHGEAVKLLQRHLDPALQRAAREPACLPRLKDLVEAIVAYHRYYGGK